MDLNYGIVPQLVEEYQQVVRNANQYTIDLDKDERLIDKLSTVQHWYYIKGDKGYLFAPSKFIGYQNNHVDYYEKFAKRGMTGSETEPRLKRWFKVVEPETPLEYDLKKELIDFIESYGKKLRSNAKIHILDNKRDGDDELDPIRGKEIEHDKYRPLEQYLMACKSETVHLTFKEIEEIIGQELCESAYTYSAYWNPNRPLVWKDFGYKMTKNLKDQTITLSKIGYINEPQIPKKERVNDQEAVNEDRLFEIKQLLIDWCNNRMNQWQDIKFNLNHCVGKTHIKFTTKMIDNILPPTNDNKGEWRNGHYVFYEINNRPNQVFIYCVVGVKDLEEKYREIFNVFLQSKNKKVKKTCCIERFEVCKYKDEDDIDTIKNKIERGLNEVIEHQIPAFQKEFEASWETIINHQFYPLLSHVGEKKETPSLGRYAEGAPIQMTINKYERNMKARQKCLEVYGYSCKICQENLEEKYGDLGKDFIHVHHIVPLHEIKGEYDLNPLTDLIPVCPNCHAIIHRKTPAYTPDEIKGILRK